MSRKYVASILLLSGLALVTEAADLQITTGTHSYANCYDTQDSATISVANLTAPISGFRLALGIDEANFGLLQVKPGAFMRDCQWEYLCWRLFHPASIIQLSLRGSHVTAVLEINGQASTSASHVPTCNSSPGQIELVKLNFLLATSDQRNPCAFLPLRFYWRDCRDNVLYSMTGDTVYVANQVSESPLTPGPLNAPFPGFGAPAHQCDSSVTKRYVPALAAVNGGFDLACSDSLFCTGDLNLDGHSFEVADLVMYINYFTVGVSAFGSHVQESIAQSDINGDGFDLTLEDLTLMVEIVSRGGPPPNTPH